MRDNHCPICGQISNDTPVLKTQSSKKMRLPTELEIHYCPTCNFLFQSSGHQKDYDEYYTSVATDTDHREVSQGELRSPVAKLQNDMLVSELKDYFLTPKKVMDFGCGEAALLVELASNFPASSFWGFDPGPAADVGQNKAKSLGLNNLVIADLDIINKNAPYDFIILSQVIEHFIDFDSLHLLSNLLAEDGMLYVEVPDSLHYENYPKREFLYYFHRLHVNHFTPQSLSRTLEKYGFAAHTYFTYAYPFKDGGEMPVMGMLFKKGEGKNTIISPSILDMANRYIAQEKIRAQEVAGQFKEFKEVLIWGAGDNFYRSAQNGGPLSQLQNMIILDQHPHELMLQGKSYTTHTPLKTISQYALPVIMAISEESPVLAKQILAIDPERKIFFV